MCSRKLRPHIIAGVVCVSAFIMVLACIITLSSARAQQIELWYSVPLCKKNATSSLYVTRNLHTSSNLESVCPTDSLNAAYNVEPEAVAFTVPMADFEPGLSYIAFTMRTDGTALFDSDKAGAEGKGAFLELSSSGLFTSRSTDDTSASPTRRLLKGGTGSGGSYGGGSYSYSSYVSRSGTYNSWGSGTVTRRGGSRTGASVVAAATYTRIYSPAPLRGSRASSTSTYSTAAYTSVRGGATIPQTAVTHHVSEQACSTPEGCDFSLPSSMTKDEWDRTRFTVPSPPGESITVSVTGALVYDPPTATSPYPLLFLSFVTEESIPGVVTTGVLLAIGVLLLCIGTPAALMYQYNKHTWLDFCVKGNGYVGVPVSSDGGGVDTGIRSIAVEDPMPMPPLPTSPQPYPYVQRNGDHHSVASIVGPYTSIDITSNDVATMMGLEGKPALQILNVSDNNLTSLVGMSSASLLYLNADTNDITTLMGVEGARALQFLSVVGNSITALGLYGAPLPSLRYLNVMDNDLVTLETILQFPNLTHVNAASNNLVHAGWLEKLPHLEAVDLSQNDIAAPETVVALAFLPSLKWLNIKGNNMRAAQLQVVRDAFENKPDFTLLS